MKKVHPVTSLALRFQRTQLMGYLLFRVLGLDQSASPGCANGGVRCHQLTTSKDNKYLILQQNISPGPGGSRHRGGRAVNQSAGGVFVRPRRKTLELETNLRKVAKSYIFLNMKVVVPPFKALVWAMSLIIQQNLRRFVTSST